MNIFQKLLLFAIAFGFSINLANGQERIQVKPGDVQIKSLELEVQKTPNFSAGNVSDKRIERPKEWFEFEAEFEVKVRAPKNYVLDQLLVRYYAGFRDESTREKTPAILMGEETLLDILVNEKNYCAAYIPPASIGKLTGDYRSADKGKVVLRGIEILYNGQIVGLWTSDGKTSEPFWRKATSPRPKTILPRQKTPFSLLWIDRYPESKVQ